MGVFLGSMKVLTDSHSLCCVLQAIKYGLIPYVPLSPELGQEATWPESHEFVISEKYWKYGWEDDPTYNGLHGSADTLLQIADWISDRERYRSFAPVSYTHLTLPTKA